MFVFNFSRTLDGIILDARTHDSLAMSPVCCLLHTLVLAD